MSKCLCNMLQLIFVGIIVAVVTAWLNQSWIMPQVQENQKRTEIIEMILSHTMNKTDLSSSIDNAVKDNIPPSEFIDNYFNSSKSPNK